MLPGLRFLFAAIVLAISLLVFGLGAAAPPEPQFAQQPEAPPVLAMVRVDQPAADKTTTDVPVPLSSPEPAVSEPAAPAEAPPAAEPEKLAAVKADDAPPPASPKAEPPAVETPAPARSAEVAPPPPTPDPSPASQPTPAASEVAPAAAEPKVAAMADPPAATSEPAPTAPAPAMVAPEPAPPPSPEATAAATRIATLGGPEVVVEAPKATEAKKPERNATSKPAPRKERRRIVRARPVVRQAVQQQLDPFGNPTLVPLTRR